ncbi:MAG: YitT family protein [Bacteroidales bacterium]|nr:YitT family protein [Bacteroidales bacterium]
MITARKFFGKVKDYFVMTLACAIFAFAWEGFMIPNGMSSGGLVGLCTVIQYATDGALQASYLYAAINASLIILSIIAFGLGFGFRTIYCIAMSSLMLKLVGHLAFLHCVPGNFFYVKASILVPVISGVLEAVGVGLIIRQGGSTGGTDIIALVVNKYWPVSLSRVFLLTDFTIICLLLFLPDKSFGDMCYGFEMMVTFALMIDVVMSGQKNSLQVLIFSDKYDKIADFATSVLDRGVTVLKSEGWFTHKERNVLLILLNYKQINVLTSGVKDIDPKAFMSISEAGNVYGEGFDPIKAGLKRKKNRKKNADN